MEKRILTVQDISCVGQCSLTVALPILSAFGLETAVLPTAVLSTHTGGFDGWTFLDATDELPKIFDKWEKNKIDFDCVYTGYLGSAKQIEYVCECKDRFLRSGGELIVDPVMADNGMLYPGFDDAFVEEMKSLVKKSDIILPNITQACFLTGAQYKDGCCDKDYYEDLIAKLSKAGAKKIVLTGVSFSPDKLGVAVWDGEKIEYHFEDFINRRSHGTGDIYASAFTGAYEKGESLLSAAAFAAKFVVKCITETKDFSEHFYGVRFEKALGLITDKFLK
ncbi:MAG: pyridoxamine kinase [Christensenellaceae bacterium]|nr:pyridoxamine kinase [Christensenellaceae bacterium]